MSSRHSDSGIAGATLRHRAVRRGAEPDRGGAVRRVVGVGAGLRRPNRRSRNEEAASAPSGGGLSSRLQRVSPWRQRLSRSPSRCPPEPTSAALTRAPLCGERRSSPPSTAMHSASSTNSQDGVLVLDLDDVPPPAAEQTLRSVGSLQQAAEGAMGGSRRVSHPDGSPARLKLGLPLGAGEYEAVDISGPAQRWARSATLRFQPRPADDSNQPRDKP